MKLAETAKSIFVDETVACIAGACAIVSTILLIGQVSFAEYVACIDMHTLTLLFSLMLVVAGLRHESVLQHTACALIGRMRDARSLSVALICCCFFGSMIVTNDVALIVFVALTYIAFQFAGCNGHFLRCVVLETVAANLGGSLSPVGNPQNIYLLSHYSIGLDSFALTMLPIVGIGAVGIAVLVAIFLPNREIARVEIAKEPIASPFRICLLGGLFICCLLCVAGVIAYWILLVIVIACGLLFFRRQFADIDYALLLTFVFFFILVENLQHVTPVFEALKSLMSVNPLAVSIAASQVMSNVPAAVLLSGFTQDATAMLAGCNIGGLGTPVASLASLISLKLYMQFTKSGGHQMRAHRYLLFFTGVNVVLLAVLCLLEALISLL